MASRKYIRIALSSEDQKSFADAKALAETQTNIAMSDAMFALSLIRQAIKTKEDTE